MASATLRDSPALLRPRHRSGVLSYDAAEEIVLYDGQSATAVSLNLTAAAIWELCNGINTVADIVTELAGTAGAQPEVVCLDVHRALNELQAMNLLVLHPDDGGA